MKKKMATSRPNWKMPVCPLSSYWFLPCFIFIGLSSLIKSFFLLVCVREALKSETKAQSTELQVEKIKEMADGFGDY